MSNSLLIVEDDVDLSHRYQTLFKRKEYDVHLASSTAEALEILERVAGVKVIMVDITIPSLGGEEFFCHVKAQPQWRRVKFLVMSNWDGLPRRSAQMGADDYAMKPANLVQLETQIDELIQS